MERPKLREIITEFQAAWRQGMNNAQLIFAQSEVLDELGALAITEKPIKPLSELPPHTDSSPQE